jgi:hypothetical protein
VLKLSQSVRSLFDRPRLKKDTQMPLVVLSTKFQGPWLEISKDMKAMLLELGCDAYNPNTDNKDMYGDAADSRWLLTFSEMLDKVEATEGFVLQIQDQTDTMQSRMALAGSGHATPNKSYMQEAEEKMGRKWQVPKIGIRVKGAGSHPPSPDALKDPDARSQALNNLQRAIDGARTQWSTTVKTTLVSCEDQWETWAENRTARDAMIRQAQLPFGRGFPGLGK